MHRIILCNYILYILILKSRFSTEVGKTLHETSVQQSVLQFITFSLEHKWLIYSFLSGSSYLSLLHLLPLLSLFVSLCC